MTPVVRRARPALGTLVDAGACGEGDGLRAITAAFAAIAAVERALSRQRTDSELYRLNAAPAGVAMPAGTHLHAVLACARDLHRASAGIFDVACGTARGDCGFLMGDGVVTRGAGVTLSLDGIAKGYAVDRAADAMRESGIASGWVNAGGDLRVFGALELPVTVHIGRRRHAVALRECALATSEYGRARRAGARSTLGRGRGSSHRAATVAAPECVLADALTKVVAVQGRQARMLVESLGASIVVVR
ncbi:MAG TPA: FAD:protein FMN transferase [Casimicrobiaceae bacterium]|nr:FAD:protein FMN transferase [Casimicrobiaceae bacterium]